jgi:hypothetical protein
MREMSDELKLDDLEGTMRAFMAGRNGASSPVSPSSPRSPRSPTRSASPPPAVEYCSPKREELSNGMKWLWESKKYMDTKILVGKALENAFEINAHAVILVQFEYSKTFLIFLVSL